MRWLDRWLGVPLCFLLSFGARWHNLRVRGVAAGRPRRALCIQLAEMGSLVLAGPAVHWLHSRGVTPWFVSFARNGECLSVAGLVPAERVFLWRTRNPWVFLLDFFRFLRWTAQQGFDAAIDFEPCSRFSALLGLLAGARLRAGYTHQSAYRGRLHSVPVPYRNDRHMSENCLALAAALLPGEPLPDLMRAEQAWRAQLPRSGDSSAGERVRALLARTFPGHAATNQLLLLNPNAGDLLPQRRWPPDRYIELARRLLARYPQACIGFIGSPAETAAVEAVAAAVDSPRCASLAGALSVAELPALYARCLLLVSNDSGPAHIASLTATPTVVMFGPETPLLYRPLGRARPLYAAVPCSPCVSAANQRRCNCADNLCMQAISVGSVLAEVAAIVDAAGKSDRRRASADFRLPNKADTSAGRLKSSGGHPCAPRSRPIHLLAVEPDR